MDELQHNALSVTPDENVTEKTLRKKRKILILTFGIVFFAALCIVLAVSNANKPINRFRSALKNGEYDVAEALYEQNNSNAKFLDNVKDTLRKLLANTEAEFASGKISSDEAHSVITGVAYYNEVKDDFDKTSNQIKVLDDSKKSYKRACEYTENEKYLDAIKEYETVIEEDTENYSSAQKEKKSAIELLCSNATQEANDNLAQGNAIAAYMALYSVGNYKNSEVAAMLANVTLEAQRQVIDQMQKLLAEENYKNAYLLVYEQPDELKNTEIRDLENSALDSLIKQADTKIISGDYDGAIALLTQKDGSALSADCNVEIQKAQKSNRIEKLSKLKGNVKVNYDKFYKVYTVVPNNIGDTILPSVAVTLEDTPLSGVSDAVSFDMYFSIISKDWIYTDLIIIDCDGIQFNLSVDSNNRNTDVYWGSVFEGTIYIHVPGSIENGANRHADLKPIIEAMESSSTITVRFSGKGGYKDATISQNEIDAVMNMWTIYQILYEDDSLVSALV